MKKNNVKTATTIVAGVVVAGVTLKEIVRQRKLNKMISDLDKSVDAYNQAVTDLRSPEMIAFGMAQDEISDRMLSGYYDDKPDASARYDYQILYNHFLSGNL